MKKVQIFPNLLTMGNLICGLLAITYTFEPTPDNFVWAARLILIALIFDALDGHVARLTRSASSFGVNFDSLADLVTFGVAPAMLCYRFIFPIRDNIGIALVLIYAGCTALRLARFNTTASTKSKKPDFMGLPCPAAASVLAALVLCLLKFNVSLNAYPLLTKATSVIIITGLSGLMVSKLPYPSIQRIGMAGNKPFHYLVVALALFGLGAVYPPIVIFLVTAGYVLFGVQESLLRKRREIKQAEAKSESSQEERKSAESHP